MKLLIVQKESLILTFVCSFQAPEGFKLGFSAFLGVYMATGWI